MEIGAYLQCYKNPYATYKCLESFRRFYPSGTIVLLSDNGYNYSKMAQFFDCMYIHCDENVPVNLLDVNNNEFVLKHCKKLIERISSAFLLIKEDYIMWLEDDVIINGRIIDNFQYDINGFCPNTIVTRLLCSRFKNLDPNRKYPFSGHGGTVFNKTNTLSSFLREDIIDEVGLNWLNYDLPTTAAQDYLFSILVTLNGGTVGPYGGHADRHDNQIDPRITVQHQYKRWYGVLMPDELKHLVADA